MNNNPPSPQTERGVFSSHILRAPFVSTHLFTNQNEQATLASFQGLTRNAMYHLLLTELLKTSLTNGVADFSCSEFNFKDNNWAIKTSFLSRDKTICGYLWTNGKTWCINSYCMWWVPIPKTGPGYIYFCMTVAIIWVRINLLSIRITMLCRNDVAHVIYSKSWQ